MLTRKQHDLLVYIHGHLHKHGISPSFDEMKDALNLKSKSGIHRLITALEERNFIRRLPHRARALEVVRLPDTLESAPRVTMGGVNIPTAVSAAMDSVSLPLVGRIAAGTPIEALQDDTTQIEIPAALLHSGTSDHYALEVSGDSMVEAGILDGDTVLIEKCATANDGTIVVALVDKAEATLKTIHYGNNMVSLKPANRTYETRSLSPNRVEVQGRLVGLLRRY